MMTSSLALRHCWRAMCASIPDCMTKRTLVLYRCISAIRHYYQSYQTVLESPYNQVAPPIPPVCLVNSQATFPKLRVSTFQKSAQPVYKLVSLIRSHSNWWVRRSVQLIFLLNAKTTQQPLNTRSKKIETPHLSQRSCKLKSITPNLLWAKDCTVLEPHISTSNKNLLL